MINDKHPLRVFLCHASGDKPAVQKLHKRLVDDGIDAWLDKEKLIAGQDWQVEITKAIQKSEVVIVCLSNQSITKEGFVQKEIGFALAVADEKPEGTIFIIPARLEICDVPNKIKRFHWVDLFTDDGYQMLKKALRTRADSIGATYEKNGLSPRVKSTSRKDFVIPERIERLIKFLKAFDYLYKKEPNTLRSIIVTVSANKENIDEDEERNIKRYHDLATRMVDNELLYKEVYEYSVNLISNTKTLDEFVKILGTRM